MTDLSVADKESYPGSGRQAAAITVTGPNIDRGIGVATAGAVDFATDGTGVVASGVIAGGVSGASSALHVGDAIAAHGGDAAYKGVVSWGEHFADAEYQRMTSYPLGPVPANIPLPGY